MHRTVNITILSLSSFDRAINHAYHVLSIVTKTKILMYICLNFRISCQSIASNVDIFWFIAI
jgi:hypothetical protein